MNDKSRGQCGGGLGDVEWVDEQGLHELTRRAGEGAEDQHTILVVARRDELLGDEVHPVVQARDETEIDAPEVLVDLRRLDMLDAQRDLVTRARTARIRGSEMMDPTVTVTSLGERGAESVFGALGGDAMLAIGIFYIPVFARLTRAVAIVAWEKEFIAAAPQNPENQPLTPENPH